VGVVPDRAHGDGDLAQALGDVPAPEGLGPARAVRGEFVDALTAALHGRAALGHGRGGEDRGERGE
jgi:hypothetical protein